MEGTAQRGDWTFKAAENLKREKLGFITIHATLGGKLQPELIEPIHHLQLIGVGHGVAY